MKKYILIAFLLFGKSNSYSQILDGRISYKATVNYEKYLEKIENNTDLSESMRSSALNSVFTSTDLMFLLEFNKDAVLFYCNSDIKRGNLSAIELGALNIYYSNFKTKTKYRVKTYEINNKIFDKELKWNITNESKKIGEHECFKATTIRTLKGRNGLMERDITAWFTPSIPVSIGIQNLHGLPGLIIELSIDNNVVKTTFSVSCIELNQKNGITVFEPHMLKN